MAKAITYYSDFLTGHQLLASLKSCCSLAGEVDQKVWSFFDPIALSAVVIVGGELAGRPAVSLLDSVLQACCPACCKRAAQPAVSLLNSLAARSKYWTVHLIAR